MNLRNGQLAADVAAGSARSEALLAQLQGLQAEFASVVSGPEHAGCASLLTWMLTCTARLQKQELLSAQERASGLEETLQASQATSAKAAQAHAAQHEALAGWVHACAASPI